METGINVFLCMETGDFRNLLSDLEEVGLAETPLEEVRRIAIEWEKLYPRNLGIYKCRNELRKWLMDKYKNSKKLEFIVTENNNLYFFIRKIKVPLGGIRKDDHVFGDDINDNFYSGSFKFDSWEKVLIEFPEFMERYPN